MWRVGLAQQRYSTSSTVIAEMGDPSRVYHLHFVTSHPAAQLSRTLREGKCVLAKGSGSAFGNCRSGVALAICHRLSVVFTYRINGLRKGDRIRPTLF